MNFQRFKRSLGTKMIAIVAMVAALTSCSKSNDIASVIPADVKFAMRFNLQQMIENAGCKVDNGKITLSPAITSSFSDQPSVGAIINTFLGYGEGLDLSDMAIFMRYNNEAIGVISLSDAKKVSENISQFVGQPKNEDGFDVFNIQGSVIAIKDNRLWIADKLEYISDAITSAKSKQIGTMPAIEQFLSADNAFAIVLAGQAVDLPSNFGDQWICGSIRFAGSEMSGELCMMDRDGKRYPFGDAIGEISTDFLRYVPAGMQLVGAMGEVKEPALKDAIAKYAAQLGDYSKFITGIDGTIAGAIDTSDAAPTNTNDLINGKFDPEKIKFIAMAHYPQALADELVTTGCDNLRLSGQIPTQEANGIYSFVVEGMNFYLGVVDGYAALSNMPLAPTANNELNTKFEGKRGVLYSYAEPTGMFGVDYSSEGSIWLESDAVKMQGRLIGTDKKFLEACVDIFTNPEFLEMMKTIINQEFANSGYQYDFDEDDVDFDDFIDESDVA